MPWFGLEAESQVPQRISHERAFSYIYEINLPHSTLAWVHSFHHPSLPNTYERQGKVSKCALLPYLPR